MAKVSFKCLPVGNLPYEDNMAATRMMVKLFEHIPYLAVMSVADQNDNLVNRTITHIPGVKIKDKRILFRDGNDNFKEATVKLDEAFNSFDLEKLEDFKLESFFFPKYMQILKRVKPKETVVNILGPFTVSQMIEHKDKLQLLSDKFYRKLIIQSVAVKAMWAIAQIKSVSPETTPIIVLEEPLLCKYGSVKRENEDVTRDIVTNLFSKVIQKIKECHGLVCIQSFEKCDWQIPIEAGADIISFDAFNNPNNLNIIAEKVNNFLVAGGRINWGIVPVKNETTVKALTIDKLTDHFIKTVESLIDAGVSERLAYNRSSVSIQGNIDKLPLIFAEKALILSTQLAKRIPHKG